MIYAIEPPPGGIISWLKSRDEEGDAIVVPQIPVPRVPE
jgi:hypothetical protein